MTPRHTYILVHTCMYVQSSQKYTYIHVSFLSLTVSASLKSQSHHKLLSIDGMIYLWRKLLKRPSDTYYAQSNGGPSRGLKSLRITACPDIDVAVLESLFLHRQDQDHRSSLNLSDSKHLPTASSSPYTGFVSIIPTHT